MKMIKQPTIPPMPKQPTFDARDTQYNLPIGTDLISRAQAIDALYSVDEYNPRSVKAIKQLPPIQPASCSEFPNNSDAISRQAAIEALTEYGNGRAVFISVGEAVIRIEQLPPAEPKKGRWIDKGVCTYVDNCRHLYKCDQCGGGWLDTPDFCPHCGAKMEVTE